MIYLEEWERDRLFVMACIPSRMLIALYTPTNLLRPVAVVVAANWLRLREKVGFFGGYAYWAPVRPVHAALWLGYAVTGDRQYLLFDITFGVLVWLVSKTASSSN